MRIAFLLTRSQEKFALKKAGARCTITPLVAEYMGLLLFSPPFSEYGCQAGRKRVSLPGNRSKTCRTGLYLWMVGMDGSSFWFALGRPLAPLYAGIMRLREHAYRRGILRQTRLSVPVISVGNLTLGGSGKTPLVQYLASMLREKGWKPAVISRGYGGATREPVNVVSDGNRVLLDAARVGDEPCLLAETLEHVPVLTGVVRRLPAARAIELGADVLVLDDGFQHLALARDLDLVLFHGDILAGNSRVFPGGVLREPVAALHRCDGFVITHIRDSTRERGHRFARLLQERFPEKPVFFTGVAPVALVRMTEQGLLVDELATHEQHRWFAFCGIAHPRVFERTLQNMGVSLAGFRSFGDHFRYRQEHLDQLVAEASQQGATALMTTEKDLVKLRHLQMDLPVSGVRIRVHADVTFDTFVVHRLQQWLEEHGRNRGQMSS